MGQTLRARVHDQQKRPETPVGPSRQVAQHSSRPEQDPKPQGQYPNSRAGTVPLAVPRATQLPVATATPGTVPAAPWGSALRAGSGLMQLSPSGLSTVNPHVQPSLAAATKHERSPAAQP